MSIRSSEQVPVWNWPEVIMDWERLFLGATTPFGVVQVSPQTITGGDHAPGYSDEHRTIEGFAFTQMSGVGWYGDLGNLLTMPTTGRFPGHCRSRRRLHTGVSLCLR